MTGLTKSYGEKNLVDKVDFTISEGQKIALVAKNGAGKSTLLKLLMKIVDFGHGEISRKNGIRIGYLSQDSLFEPEKKVFDILYDFDVQVEYEKETALNIIANKLGLTPLLEQKIGSLSGGELKRVALAKVLAQEADMLILDEPTNHLDLEMIEWLERYLKKQPVTLLMVTHDRYFLERVCTDIFELDRGRLFSYPGNYSYFLEKKAIREENEAIEVHKMKQLFSQELSWMRKSPQGRGTKSVFRQERFGEIQKNFRDLKNAHLGDQQKLEIDAHERRLGSKILKIKNLKKSFGEKTILENFSHDFTHGQRVGIIGKNGVGKSTFINLILGNEPTDSGLVEQGETVVFGHYEQKDVQFHPDKKLIDVVSDTQLLQKFLFPKSQRHSLANNLSGGEKRRLYLLTILLKKPNFLILDEPTNDLDLITLGVLENFLLQYKGCLMVISHDRFFMDKIIDQLFVFEGKGVVKEYWGTYSEYREQEKLKLSKEKELKKKNKSAQEAAASDSSQKKSLSYMEKRELNDLVKEIDKLEKRKDEINKHFDNKDLPFYEIKELSEELGNVLKSLAQKETRWFDLSSKEAGE
ncbi:MAG TPA: ABC-F family ATP-binding cassette domain-containing protein [Candidatus Absconditabacterales bacterium]|nr:ABC-F family ATP-binding cassette domain-containing protein [Candidatus Absconditabacterales bacterium]